MTGNKWEELMDGSHNGEKSAFGSKRLILGMILLNVFINDYR